MVDVLLSPIALVLAIGLERGEWELLWIAGPLVLLLGLFTLARNAHVDDALALTQAYRGTTQLLAEVVEHDDEYTGAHSQGVVALSLEVADRLGLDARRRRNVELAALLHDVGKLRVPNEIINKPGPLDAEERAVINRHTVEGERILSRVGGVLSEAGRLVRSSHERWDGTGYPDGLVGHETPLESRIVACCDAFNAMTTTRSYRPAMSFEAAVAELRAGAGTQFDPDVAHAVIDIVEGAEAVEHQPRRLRRFARAP